MSLVSQGMGVSGGALGGLGVVGSRCLGGSGSPLRVSDPFPIATPSLSCSASPAQLQPQFHQGAGVVRCGVRLSGKGGHRDRPSFSGVLQSPLCHSQSHRGLATCHRPLMPQRLGGALQFSHGDCPIRSPVSPAGGLDGVPGSPGCLPPGSSSSGFSPLPEVLRGGYGVSVSSPVLRPFLSPSGVHPCHGSYFVHHASPRFSSSPLFGRLASPGLHLPGTSKCEGLPPLALSSPRGHSQSFEELFGSDSDAGLSRDDPRDFSFEGFPDPQTGSEVLPPSSGVLIRPSPTCFGLAESSRDDVIHVRHRSRLTALHAFPLGDPHLSGLWSPLCSSFSINQRELLAILYEVQGFLPHLRGRTVAVYSDNSTALAYLVVSECSGSGTSSTLRGPVGSPSASVHSWPSQCAG